MIYRVYQEIDYRYEKVGDNLSYSQMLEMLDVLISEDDNNKILVIEHDVELDIDNPAFLYTGNYESYLKYRDLEDNPKKLMR